MILKSLGIQTDLNLIDGDIEKKENYWVVRSPKQPDFYWGNFLIFPRPPQTGDFEHWCALFEHEFKNSPRVKHQTFIWDIDSSQAPDIASFQHKGFHMDKLVVLSTAQARLPPHPNLALEVREIKHQEEWDEAIHCQLLSRHPDMKEAPYLQYLQGRLASLQKKINLGQGAWYGAFLEGKQVGNLGIFHHNALARFQMVCTHPSYRRIGVCKTLVHQVSTLFLQKESVKQLVMLADKEDVAADIYKSVGFQQIESLLGLCLWPSEHSA